jgi:hypothetical protein
MHVLPLFLTVTSYCRTRHHHLRHYQQPWRFAYFAFNECPSISILEGNVVRLQLHEPQQPSMLHRKTFDAFKPHN